jgi:predicted RNA-binding Zn ribbon-like protein
MAPDVLVWLVNEWGSVPRAAAGEDRAPYPDAGLLAGLLAGSGVRACPPELLTPPALRRTADRLHPVFAAGPGDRADLVNSLLTETAIRPALELIDGQPAETWLVEDAGEGLVAAAALTLRHQLAAADPGRLGTCEGRRCADAYIDTSPAARRRFCSVTCQNRARVAAWRRQRSQHDATQPSQ